MILHPNVNGKVWSFLATSSQTGIQKVLALLCCQMQLFSRSWADMVLREWEERKRGGKGMAEGGGERLGGTEMMDGVSEREP